MNSYSIDGQRVNQQMFDWAVLVEINRINKRSGPASVWQVGRDLYFRPNMRTFRNIAGAFGRLKAARKVKLETDGIGISVLATVIKRRVR